MGGRSQYVFNRETEWLKRCMKDELVKQKGLDVRLLTEVDSLRGANGRGTALLDEWMFGRFSPQSIY